VSLFHALYPICTMKETLPSLPPSLFPSLSLPPFSLLLLVAAARRFQTKRKTNSGVVVMRREEEEEEEEEEGWKKA